DVLKHLVGHHGRVKRHRSWGMARICWQRRCARAWQGVLVIACVAAAFQLARAQEPAPSPRPVQETSSGAPVPIAMPAPAASDKPLPINLPTALQLANVRPIDIQLASQRIRIAAAGLERAQVLWLPTVYL